ncbi:hypothetical protein C8J56DRAFT_1048068 [Mycena floridula]|nr:hypothetical protein C8J56DRAFT_1048068 [Mycena floridula]
MISDGTFNDFTFLDHLTLPLLTTLSFDGAFYTPLSVPCPAFKITSLVARSAFALTSLSWKNLSISFSDWITVLRAVPSVRSLTVNNNRTMLGDQPISDAFFEQLQAHLSSASPILLPKLENLDVAALALSLETFVRAIQSRWVPENNICDEVVSLKSVPLVLGEAIMDEVALEPLEYLKSVGMKIVLRDSKGVAFID